MADLSDDDIDRFEESPRAATDRHVVQLVAEVRRLRSRVAVLEAAMRDHATCRICTAVLEDDRETWPSRCGCGRVVPCRHCNQEDHR